MFVSVKNNIYINVPDDIEQYSRYFGFHVINFGK